MLRATYIGYATLRDTLVLGVGERRTINIALSPGAAALDEVLVETERTSGAARITAGQQTVRPRDLEAVCEVCQTAIPLSGHVCAYCFTYHEAETAFCHECGEAMTRVCPHCQTTNWGGNEHCAHCNQPLDLFEILKTRTKKAKVARLQKQIEAARALKEKEREDSRRRMRTMRENMRAYGQQMRRRRLWRTVKGWIISIVTIIAIALIIYLLFLSVS